jgi:hypothetical protein
MNQRPRGNCFWWLVALASATILVVDVAPALTKRTSCHEVCDGAIATCVKQGYRRGFCVHEVHSLCKHGSSICTTPTTLPMCLTTTTSTTMPSGSGACLGAAGCSANPSGVRSTAESAAALEQDLLGTWYDCKQPSSEAPFGGDAAGIEFTADQQWFFLKLDGVTLTRETGFGQGGTYEIIDTSIENGPGHFQLNLDVNSGGTYIVGWALASQPQLLLIQNFGVQQALYSHIPGAPACSELGGSSGGP